MPMPPRLSALIRLGLSLALAAALAACGPNVPKADAYEQTADGMMAASAFVPAMSMMERSIKYDPNEPRRWVKLGRAQRAAEQPALAAMSYQRALDLDPANIEALENMAVLLVRAGRYDEAKGYVDPLMSLQPDDIAGLLSLGAIAMFRQQYAEADKYADKLIQAAPSSIGGYTLKARVYAAQGKMKEAAAVLAQQVALNPTDPDLALQLMDFYKASKSVTGIRNTAKVLAALMPNDPRYQMEMVRAYHAEGKEDQANDILGKILVRYRGNADVMKAVARYWRGSMPRDQALAKIVDLTSKLGGHAKSELANMLIDEGLAATAVKLLEKDAAANVDPGNTDLHATYARGLLAIGKTGDAGYQAFRVLDFDYTNPVALVVRARITFATKDYPKALNDAQNALSNDRTSEEALLLIPQIYMAMGNKVLAERGWGDAQAALPHSGRVNRAWTAWLVSQGRQDDALDVMSTFARGNPNDFETWRAYRDLCVAAKDKCARTAAQQLAMIR